MFKRSARLSFLLILFVWAAPGLAQQYEIPLDQIQNIHGADRMGQDQMRGMQEQQRALRDMQRRQQELQQMTQTPGGFEEGTPLHPEAAAAEREEQSATGLLKTVAFAFVGAFVLIIVGLGWWARRTGSDGGMSDPIATRKTLEGLKKERATPQELAEKVMEAIRFGSYPQYRSLFLSQTEAASFMKADKLNSYINGTLTDTTLQQTFRGLIEVAGGASARFKAFRGSEPVTLPGGTGQTVRLVSNAEIALQTAEGGLGRLPCGSMVEIDGKWKLFVPKVPGLPTADQPSISAGHPQVHP